jgi:LmbE family N-acetylglucosaminyl deacetylase
MLSVLDLSRVKRLLCVGAHCDDIGIGVGGTILRLAKAQAQLEPRWVVVGGHNPGKGRGSTAPIILTATQRF